MPASLGSDSYRPNTVMATGPTPSWRPAQHRHGDRPNTVMATVPIPSWRPSQYRHGDRPNTVMATVPIPSWRPSQHRHGDRPNTVMATVPTPSWRPSQYRHGDRPNTVMATVPTPSWRPSQHRHGYRPNTVMARLVRAIRHPTGLDQMARTRGCWAKTLAGRHKSPVRALGITPSCPAFFDVRGLASQDIASRQRSAFVLMSASITTKTLRH
jgi:hypothetical protein